MSLRGAGRVMAFARRSLLDTSRKPTWWLVVAILVLAGSILTAYGGRIMLPVNGYVPANSPASLLASNAAIATLLMIPTATFVFGLRIARDRALGMTRLLAASGLRPAEYVAGHVIAATILVSIVLVAILLFGMLATEALVRQMGDAEDVPYARYAASAFVMLWLPTFAAGATSAAVAAAWGRSSAVVFCWCPLVAVSTISGWRPEWMPAWMDRVLVCIDITGSRWLESELFAVNRGAEFYGSASLGALLSEGAWSLAATRIATAAFAAAAICAAAWWCARTARPRHRLSSEAVSNALGAAPRAAPPCPPDLAAFAVPPCSPSPTKAAVSIALSDARALGSRPGLWCWIVLTSFITLTMAVAGTEGVIGEVELASSGKFVSDGHGIYVFMSLVLTVSATIALMDRGEAARRDAMAEQMPIPTGAIVIGRLVACLFPAVILFLSVLPTVMVAHAIQGNADPIVQAVSPWPVVASWVVLILPTTVFFAAALMLACSFVRSAGAVVSAGAGLLAVAMLPPYFGVSVPWWCDFAMFDAPGWSDLAPFQPDRGALLTNRVMVLALAVAIVAITIRVWPRVRPDLVGSPGAWRRLRSAALSPIAVVSLMTAGACSFANWFGGWSGPDGYVSRARIRAYVEENMLTWLRTPQPRLKRVRLDITLDPAQDRFHGIASMTLENPYGHGLRSFALTVSPSWTFDWIECLGPSGSMPVGLPGKSSMLVCVSAAGVGDALGPGEACSVEFSYEGSCTGGMGKAPRSSLETFMVDGGVLMTSQTLDFLPRVGFVPELLEAHSMRPDRYEAGPGGVARAPLFGGGGLIEVDATVTIPKEYRANLPGVLVSESVSNGLRTMRWKTDRPISEYFHIVAGRWVESKGRRCSVWHSPLHGQNVPSMVEALDAARDRYSIWFGEYPWRDLRISEFPALADYAQSGEGNIVFGESMGFRALRTNEIDAAFTVTAHEAAHQWWGGIVLPRAGAGGNVLSEGLAQYSAIRLVGECRGTRMQHAFLRQLEEQYLLTRDPTTEEPLDVFDDGSADAHTLLYHRGGWVFWMLANRIGFEASDAAHRAFVAHFADRHAFAGLDDYVGFMRRHADADEVDAFAWRWIEATGLGQYSVAVTECIPSGERWKTTVRIADLEDLGEPVEVAITNGEPRWSADGTEAHGYRAEIRTVTFGGRDGGQLTIETDFEPVEAVVDPNVKILQIGRSAAVARIDRHTRP